MEFLVSIEKGKLRAFERVKGHYEPFFIEGEECFSYEVPSIKQCADEFLKSIAYEKNLADSSCVDLVVLENFDELLNSKFRKAWGERVKFSYHISEMMEKVIQTLQGDKELQVSKYGINYDGFSFVMNDGRVDKSDFDLLAYTVHAKDLINLNLFDN